MTANLPPQYDPQATEAKWQKYWEDNQTFKADPEKGGEPYCVVIPPPNVTGSLHMGHAFEETLIDVLVRYHRMTGRNTLWLPGTDHASIAVQTILEKQLKAEGKTRHDLGREKFLERRGSGKLNRAILLLINCAVWACQSIGRANALRWMKAYPLRF